MHIECNDRTPRLDTLDHLPPLLLHINYWHPTGIIKAQLKDDESSLLHSLHLRDRVRHLYLELEPSIVHKYLVRLERTLSNTGVPFTLDRS
jgi:hypothetical protein